MRLRLLLIVPLMTVATAGCSSISLPSLPSLPWSSSAAKPDPNAEALFEEGMRNFTDKRYARAIDSFTKIKTDHPFSPQVVDAELKVADSYYLNQQYPEAINAFKEFHSLHPNHESIPFVVYRLGQAHLDQFTSTDREQKNTLIAKGYFESVITNYPKSPYAADAREKLAKCIQYLAEYDYNVAHFYFQQEKYPAARDRFEEIVRKYRGTPTAVKSLFFLGESYRKEKNNLKAGLAYEALIQHYPESKFSTEAKTQLAQLDKDKQDPLAMLLMRDRRPTAAPASETTQETAIAAKLKDVNNLVAKKEVVHEEPGDAKSLFRRVVDKLNPFSASDDEKQDEGKKKEPESAMALFTKNNAGNKEQSRGFFAWLNPFSSRDSNDNKASVATNSSQLMDKIDDSLKGKGVDAKPQTAAVKPPPADLPPVQEAVQPQADTAQLLTQIDAGLKRAGQSVGELPPPPPAAQAFKDAAAAQAIAAQTVATPASSESLASSALLSGIDQKLKLKGVEPAKFESPPATQEAKQSAPKKAPAKPVELEPKLAVEKGPLFLGPTPVQNSEQPAADQASSEQQRKPESTGNAPAPSAPQLPKALVRGPAQPQAVSPAPKPSERKPPAPGEEEEPKGLFDQLKTDVESIGKLLNPFRW